jgi:hypothetical protein
MAFEMALAAMSGIADVDIGEGPDDPADYREAMATPEAAEWQAAFDKEHANLVAHDVYVWENPRNAPVMKSKTVWRRKRTAEGEIRAYKVRICARGDTQIPGLQYNPKETSATVMRFETLRVMLSIAAVTGAAIRQFDIVSAYLHGQLKPGEVIYMRPPAGLEHPSDTRLVWRLKRPLYGTMQGGNYWARERDAYMRSIGWTKLDSDPCAFRKDFDDGFAIVVFWVDDATGIGPKNRLLELEASLNARYGISGQGELTWTLGMAFSRSFERKMVFLSQKLYIETLVKRFGQDDAKTVLTPLAPGTTLSRVQCPTTDDETADMHHVPYRELVGALLYVMVATRPVFGFAVGVLCRFMANPGRAHWEAAKRVLRYLKGTSDRALGLGGDLILRAYTDADYAGDQDDRKSTGAYVFTIGDGAVSWASKKQPVVALSTLEAEYMAMTQAAKEAIWIRSLLRELGCNLDDVLIHGDNQGAIALSRSSVFHNRSKHIDIQYHFIRSMLSDGIISIDYLPTISMLADILTKSLAPARHEELARALGIVSPARERGGVLKSVP